MTLISSAPGVALHHRITEILRGAILSGRYTSQGMLPGEDALTQSFAVSRGTIRRALLTLENEGLIERQAGRGTRVVAQASPRFSIEAQQRSYSDLASRTSYKLIEVTTAQGPDGQQWTRMTRLRVASETPLWFITAELPAAITAGMTEGDFSTYPLVDLLKRQGHLVTRIDEEISATLADPSVASLLGVPVASALVEHRRTLMSADQRILCRHLNLTPPSKCVLRWSLTSEGPDPQLSSFKPYPPLNSKIVQG